MTAPPGSSAPPRPGWAYRARFASIAALLAAVPLALAAWAVGRVVAGNEQSTADSHLSVSVRSGNAQLAARANIAAQEANGLALNPRLQRAIVRGDVPALRAYSRAHRRVSFVVRGRTVTAPGLAAALTRSTAVTHRGVRVGRVIVSVPLGKRLTVLGPRVGLPPSGHLAVTRHRLVVAGFGAGARGS